MHFRAGEPLLNYGHHYFRTQHVYVLCYHDMEKVSELAAQHIVFIS